MMRIHFLGSLLLISCLVALSVQLQNDQQYRANTAWENRYWAAAAYSSFNNSLFALTIDNLVLRSDDNGLSWTRLCSLNNRCGVSVIFGNQEDWYFTFGPDNSLYITRTLNSLTCEIIYRVVQYASPQFCPSAFNGVSGTIVLDYNFNQWGRPLFAIHPNGTLYTLNALGSSVRISASYDYGNTSTVIYNAAPVTGGTLNNPSWLYIHPQNTSVWYIRDPDDDFAYSFDSGNSWQIAGSFPCSEHFVMTHPLDPSVVFCYEGVSYDYGQTWTAVYEIYRISDANRYVYNIFHTVHIDNSISNRVYMWFAREKYFGSHPGVEIIRADITNPLTLNQTTQWQVMGTARVPIIDHITSQVVTARATRIAIVQSYKLFVSVDSGVTFNERWNTSATDGRGVTKFTSMHNLNGMTMVGIDDVGHVFRSTDGALSWTQVYTPPGTYPNSMNQPRLHCGPFDDGPLIVDWAYPGKAPMDVYLVSLDGGLTWHQRNSGVFDDEISWAFGQTRAQRFRLVLISQMSSSYGFQLSLDGGLSFSLRSLCCGVPTQTSQCSGCNIQSLRSFFSSFIDPHLPNRVWFYSEPANGLFYYDLDTETPSLVNALPGNPDMNSIGGLAYTPHQLFASDRQGHVFLANFTSLSGAPLPPGSIELTTQLNAAGVFSDCHYVFLRVHPSNSNLIALGCYDWTQVFLSVDGGLTFDVHSLPNGWRTRGFELGQALYLWSYTDHQNWFGGNFLVPYDLLPRIDDIGKDATFRTFILIGIDFGLTVGSISVSLCDSITCSVTPTGFLPNTQVQCSVPESQKGIVTFVLTVQGSTGLRRSLPYTFLVTGEPFFCGVSTAPEVAAGSSSGTSDGLIATIVVLTLVGVGVVIFVILLVIYLVRKKKKIDQGVELLMEVNVPKGWTAMEDVTLGALIGEGSFGSVYRGVWQSSTTVACKSFKDVDHQKNFAAETNILQSLSHPNIIRYLGVARIAQKLYIVTEFMNLGSLDVLLRHVRPDTSDPSYVPPASIPLGFPSSLSVRDLLLMAKHAAAGMQYLEFKKVIHRDLALRNLLVTNAGANNLFIVKVSDFGLSRSMDSSEYYRSSKGSQTEMPIKWSAPESLELGTFDTRSDVYAFGITLWEVFSWGKAPYRGFTNKETVLKVLNGYRMPLPEGLPEGTGDLINLCWSPDRNARPSFRQIFQHLSDILEKNFPIASSSPDEGKAPLVLDMTENENLYN